MLIKIFKIRIGPDIRSILIYGQIPNIEIIRPNIRQFNLLYLTTKITLSKLIKIISWYYSNKLVAIIRKNRNRTNQNQLKLVNGLL